MTKAVQADWTTWPRGSGCVRLSPRTAWSIEVNRGRGTVRVAHWRRVPTQRASDGGSDGLLRLLGGESHSDERG